MECPQRPSYAAPLGAIETTLAAIWAEILAVTGVGRHDRFRQLGGGPGTTQWVIEKIRQTLGVSVPVTVLEEDLPLSELAKTLRVQRRRALQPILARPASSQRQASFAQQRLWVLLQMGELGAAYHAPFAFRLTGKLHEAVLYRALEQLVRRHEALRTRFEPIDGTLWQWVAAPDVGFDLQHQDPGPGRPTEEQLPQMLVAEASRPFDLQRGPLVRGLLIRIASQDHVLLVTLHHLVCDGWSLEILVRELSVLYAALLRAEVDPLEPLGIQYADYADWQRHWLSEPSIAAESSYWRTKLAGAPTVIELPTDRKRPARQDPSGDVVALEFDEELTEQLKSLSRRCESTLYMTLLAGWAIVLARLAGQDEVVIGTPTANRARQELQGLVGFFANTLALRIDLGREPTVHELLTRTRVATFEAYEHQDLPFEQVVEAVKPVRSLAHAPLFQTMFVWHSDPAFRLDLPGLETCEIAVQLPLAKFDLTLTLSEEGGRIVGTMNYATALFDVETVRRHASYLRHILSQMVMDAQRMVSGLDLLPAPERRVLAEWSARAKSFPAPRCLHELFEIHVERNPSAIAVVHEEWELSYGQLNAHANRLAHHLRRLGVGPDRTVAVCVERSLELVRGWLAILKAGGAYVPLDPAMPTQRLAYMLEDSGAVIVLTHTAARSATAAAINELLHPPVIIEMGADQDRWDCGDQRNPDVRQIGLNSRNLAYVIYTSGSTGAPKGVMVEHASVVRLFAAAEEYFDFDHTDVWTLFHSFAFDFSVWELWGALLYGGRLVLVPRLKTLSPGKFHRLLRDQGVTVLNQTPGAFQQIMDAQGLEEGPRAHSLRWVIFGGEALEPASLRTWVRRFGLQRPRLVNMYGITETTVHVTCWPLEAQDIESGGRSIIGRPLPDLKLSLLDARGRPVPIGAIGEIYVGGAGVARGYLNRPDLTAEQFVPDPDSEAPNDRMYRTGDLGRWLADGRIEFLGRNDFQVKIRGFRIELGEIEARLLACPGVKAAVVLARDDVPGDRRLVAYYTIEPGSEVGVAELKARLLHSLADYMVPAAYVCLPVLPLTPNGKVNRNALPPPDAEAYGAAAYEAPRGPVEELIASIWREGLNIQRVGRHSNFFQLGGHSLRAVWVIERLRRAGLSVDFHALFSMPTVAELASLAAAEHKVAWATAVESPMAIGRISPELPPLVKLSQEEIDQLVAIIPGGIGNLQDVYPLVPIQEGMLFHSRLAREGDPYLLWTLMSFADRGRLDAFVTALEAVVMRHDILRTSIHWEGLSNPVQVVWRRAPLLVEEVTFGAAVHDVCRELEERFHPRRYRLDLTRAPLMRLWFSRDAAHDRWVAVWLLHHIIDDNTSLRMLRTEIEAHLDGEAASLEPPVPFRTLVAALRGDSDRSAHDAFFRRLLGDVDEPTLPFGLRNVHGDGSGVAEARSVVGEDLARQLRVRAQALGVTTASLFHVAWALVLARASGREAPVFGTVLFGRMRASEGIGRILGPFINTLPVLIRLSGRRVEACVRETHALLAELMSHEHASLAEVQASSQVSPGTPLFTAVLNYRHNVLQSSPGVARNVLRPGIEYLAREERTNYGLLLSVDDWGHEFGLCAQVAPTVGPERVCAMMLDSLERLVAALERAPDSFIDTLDVLPREERNKILLEWNATEATYPKERCLHQLFESQVELDPHAVAVVYEGQSLSYGRLNAQANRLAMHLRDLGVGAECPVAICMQRSLAMAVGLFGILKAGGAYVPLDPTYPPERLAYMLEDCAATTVLMHAPTLEFVREATLGLARPPEMLDLEADEFRWAAKESHDCEPRAIGLTSRNLAYIIYTSGSTGMPKGVMTEHHAVVNRLCWGAREHVLGRGDAVLQKTSFCFDVSVWEFFWPLMRGARLVLARAGAQGDPEYLLRVIREEQITTLHFVPSMLQAFLASENVGSCTGVRDVFCSGEELSGPLARRLETVMRGTRVHNLYGPTEAAIEVTAWSADPLGMEEGESPTIGRPISNVRIHLLDRLLRPVPVGVAGEIHIGGVCVARGYLRRPALSAERFIPDPFGPDPGARLYRTGDLGRYRLDGTIEFLGRNDFQVKIRGFRVELGEIEARLMEHAGVREAVVLAREDQPGDKRLVAYYTQAPGCEVRAEDLKSHLSRSLAAYMVPAAYVLLAVLPLTPSGKLDRKRLPPPDDTAYGTRPYVAPIGATELALAEIWRTLLTVKQVGREDEFFALGGNSLLAMRLGSRIATKFSVRIPLAAVFQHSVFTEMAGLVQALVLGRAGTSESCAMEPPLVPRQPAEPIPLAFTQQSFCNGDKVERLSARTVSGAQRVSGRLHPEALHASFVRLVQRHESLRMRVKRVEGVAWQEILPAIDFDLAVVDLTGVAEDRRDVMLDTTVRGFVNEKVPLLGESNLFDAGLLKLADEDHVLVVVMHHIIADGLSLHILFRDVWSLYTHTVQGGPLSLPEVPVQFADYAVWQHRSERYWQEYHGTYWVQRLAGAARVRVFPATHSAGPVQSAFADLPIQLRARLTAELCELSRRERTTLAMSLLTAYAALLLRWSGKSDTVIQFVTSGRQRAELENTLGPLASVLYLRIQVTEGDTLADLLQSVTREYLAACEHDDFGRVNAQPPRPDLSLCAGFNWRPATSDAGLDCVVGPEVGLELRPFAFESPESNDEVSEAERDAEPVLFLSESTESVSGVLCYRSDLVTPDIAACFREDFGSFANWLVKDSRVPLADLPCQAPSRGGAVLQAQV